MTTDVKTARQRATAMAAKEQRARDAELAMHEYEAEQLAIRANTERLRALRLAKEAADQEAADRQAAKAKVRKNRKSSSAANSAATPGADPSADLSQ